MCSEAASSTATPSTQRADPIPNGSSGTADQHKDEDDGGVASTGDLAKKMKEIVKRMMSEKEKKIMDK